MIVGRMFDWFLVDERRSHKSKNHQRRCCPAQKIHPGRAVPVEPGPGRTPEPKVFYLCREWFEAEIEKHNQRRGDAHQPKAIGPGLAPRPKHQPSDAASAENGDEPDNRHSPRKRLE